MNSNENNLLEDNWEARLIDYSMGTMSQAEAQEFERQLNECRVHVKLADNYAQVVGWMGAAAAPAEPPGGHKSRLMSRLAATPQEHLAEQERPTPPLQPTPITAAASAVPTIATDAPAEEIDQGASPTSLDEYRTRRASRSRTLWLGAAVAVLALLVLAGWMSSFLGRVYIPPGYVAIAVQSQPGAPESSGVLFYNPERREAYFYANGLQSLSAEQVYEMWLLPKGGGDPVPAGIFNAGAGGTARHEIQAPTEMGQFAGVAVSLENAPGGKVPAGPILLVGQYDTNN